MYADLGKPGHRGGCGGTSVSSMPWLNIYDSYDSGAEQTRMNTFCSIYSPNQEMGRWAELHSSFPKFANDVIYSNFPGKEGVSEGAERSQDPYTNEYLSSCDCEVT